MRSIFRKASEVSGLTLVSRVLGLVRDMLIAGVLGAGWVSDAFFMAFRPFDLLRKTFSDGIMTIAFVPVFSSYLELDRPDQARAMFMSALVLLSFSGTLLVLSGIVLAPLMVRGMAPGFEANPEQFRLTVLLLKIMMPYLGFVMLVSLSMGVLNSYGHFRVPALTPVLFNLVVILATVAVSKTFNLDITWLAVGVGLGGLIQVILQIPFLFTYIGTVPYVFKLFHPGIVQAAKKMLPSIIGAASYQLNVLIASFFASSNMEGSVSFLYYSDRLVQFPLALFGGAFCAVLLPDLSRSFVAGNLSQASRIFERGGRLVFFVTIPAMMGLLAIHEPVVRLFFEQGQFDGQAANHTAACLFYLVTGLWAYAGTRLFVTLHFACSSVAYPFAVGVLTMGINGVICFFLGRSMGYQGLALAVSLSSAVGFACLFARVPKGVDFSRARIMVSACRAIILSGIMFFPVHWAAGQISILETGSRLMSGMAVFACIALGVCIYGGLGLVGAAREMDMVKQLIKRNRQ